jgi:hypothetical protein
LRDTGNSIGAMSFAPGPNRRQNGCCLLKKGHLRGVGFVI